MSHGACPMNLEGHVPRAGMSQEFSRACPKSGPVPNILKGMSQERTCPKHFKGHVPRFECAGGLTAPEFTPCLLSCRHFSQLLPFSVSTLSGSCYLFRLSAFLQSVSHFSVECIKQLVHFFGCRRLGQLLPFSGALRRTPKRATAG